MTRTGDYQATELRAQLQRTYNEVETLRSENRALRGLLEEVMVYDGDLKPQYRIAECLSEKIEAALARSEAGGRACHECGGSQESHGTPCCSCGDGAK
jgi:regulator of replication initiation timing